MEHPDNPDLCACGESADEVSMAHFLSCGANALVDDRATANTVVDNVATKIQSQLSRPGS